MGAGRKSPFAAFRGGSGDGGKGASDDGGAGWDGSGGGAGEYVNGDMLWNESIADALGYGKK
jgi:hypothetical protein